ncbi:MAG: hypothetical protein WAK33_12590 [Silvibacterium sp.]
MQKYPLPLLLPTAAIVVVGAGVNHALAALNLSKFGHFALAAGLLIHFFLTSLAFLCVANYTARNESNSEPPEVRKLFDNLAFPGYGKLLAGLLTRFAFALVGAGLSMVVLSFAFRVLKTTHHAVPRSISGPAYLWVAIIVSVLILSRWVLAIPLFVQSKGLLKWPLEASVKSIRGRRGFVVAFTLSLVVISYPLVRLTSPLHPHLSDGAARYAPQFLEIVAAHCFGAVVWTWWMIVMTMLAMHLQGTDEPLAVLPLAPA